MKDKYIQAIANDKSDKDYTELFNRNKNHSLKTLIFLYKGHYMELFWSVVFFVIKHSPVWVLPIATSNIINAATSPDKNTTRDILLNVALMAVMIFQNIFTNYIHTWLYSKAIRNVEKDLRSALVRKLQQLSISYHKEMESGRLQSKIMRDVEQVETLSSQIFISLLSIVLNIVVALGIVIIKDITVFVFFGATIPLAVLIMAFFKGKIKRYNSEFRNEMEETSVQVMEMVEMIPVTRAHALEKEETSKMQHRLNHVAEKGLQLDMVQTYFSSISWVTFQIFQVICLGFTGYLASKGIISVGDVVLYQTYFSTIVNNVSSIIGLIPIVSKGLESVNSISDVLTAEDIEDNHRKKKLKNVNGEIEFKDVSFSYSKDEAPILTHLNFHIQPGETIAFVGPSGAGKSTILNMVIGFSKALGGEVLIDGNNINSLNLNSYRKHIAVVPQTSILFSGTIKENITYGLNNISDEELNQVLIDSTLKEMIDNLPDGIDTKIQEHGGNLSGGQRQRISIARAFVRNPKILILDEATSALDTISEKQIQKATHNLTKNRTTLIVAHRLSTIRDADRIAVIDNGGVAELGTYEELMEKKGIFYKMCKMQM
ncbi:MAG: ABC transporter ATP-binding protein/permease [Lachnospiraceae bacterium]|nr:ABC transporter ATP-binding protein/permease [Lachnospiraceae bacterium]